MNFYVDFFLLSAVKKLMHLNAKLWRLCAAALLGGACSLAAVLSLEPLINFLLLMLFSLLMSGVAFGFGQVKLLLRAAFAFIVFSLLFSGLNLLLIELFGIRAAVVGGKVYYDIDLLTLILLTAVFYLCFLIADKFREKNTCKKLFFNVKAVKNKKEAEFLCKLDTGNSLTEPFSGDPVILVKRAALAPLLDSEEGLRFRLVPYGSIGGEGILKAFRPDELFIDGRKSEKSYYIAIYEGEIDKHGRFGGIINYP